MMATSPALFHEMMEAYLAIESSVCNLWANVFPRRKPLSVVSSVAVAALSSTSDGATSAELGTVAAAAAGDSSSALMTTVGGGGGDDADVDDMMIKKRMVACCDGPQYQQVFMCP